MEYRVSFSIINSPVFLEGFMVFSFHTLGFSLAGTSFGEWYGQEPSFDFFFCLFDPGSMWQSQFLHYSGGHASPRLSLSLTGCGKSIKDTHFCRLWDPVRVKPVWILPVNHRLSQSGEWPRPFLPSMSSFLSQGHTGEVWGLSLPPHVLLMFSSPCLHDIVLKEH